MTHRGGSKPTNFTSADHPFFGTAVLVKLIKGTDVKSPELDHLVRHVPTTTGIPRGEFVEFPRSVIAYDGLIYAPHGGALSADAAHQLGAALASGALAAGHVPTLVEDTDSVPVALPSPVPTPVYANSEWTYFPHRTGYVAAHADGFVMAGIEVLAGRAWSDGAALIAAARSLKPATERTAA